MANYDKHNKHVRLKKFSFFSQGNSYDFNPDKVVTFGGAMTTMLEMHKKEAKHRSRKDVFILDGDGKMIDLTK